MHGKDQFEPKYQFLINEPECVGLMHCHGDKNSFIECSSVMNDVYEKLMSKIQEIHKKYWSCLMIWLLISLVTKRLTQKSLNYLSEVGN